MAEGNKLFSLLWIKPGVGGGGHSLIWPIWGCAAEQGTVFRLLSLTGWPFGPEAMNRGGEFWRCAVYVCDKHFFST